MFTGMQGFFGGLGGPGQGAASRAGKYDQFGRPVAPQTMSSDLGGATNFRGDDQPMGLRGGRYDQFGRPLAPGSGGPDSGPKRALLPAPGVVYPRSLRTQEPTPQGAARVTSAPVGPSKEAMIEHACRPIMKVDKTSSHYPWAEKEEPSQLMPPPLMPGFDPPGQSRGDQTDRDRRNHPGTRLDRPGLGFGENYDRGDPDKRRDVAGRSYDSTSSRARSPDRRSSDRKGRVDVRFEGRGLRDLYQDNDFGKGKDKPGDRRSDDRRSDDRRSDDRRSDDRRSDSRDGGRRKDDNRGRSNERRDRGRDRDDRDQKSGSRSRDDGGRSGGSWDGDRRDSSEESRRKERLEQQRNRQMQRSNSMQDIGQVDDFDSAWKKASAVPARDQDLFGSTQSSAQSAWWTSCTICKMNFRYKEEFTAHVDEPLHYINLEKVRKEHAKEKAVKKVANVSQTASAVESIIYHCKICNISLNGWANFNQHVSSQIHLVHFIKNVGPKGDPKGLEYFEVSDKDAPEADGRNQNNAASLLTDWRRCKCCNMEIPSWERYKLHLRTQQHFDNTVSDLLREVIQEETNFIKKQAANGQEKNVEDIERNRKAFWETQMPLNHIRPSQGQMDDAYSNFLKEAGIDDDNRQGDSSNSQSSPHFREQRGGLQQQKSDQGRQQPGRRQHNRGPDGGSGYDHGRRQQTSPSSQQGGANRFDQAQESIGRPASSSSTGAGLSSQGQSVLNLFDKFLLQTGGEKLSNPQSQGQGQDNQASKLLDTIQQKLENIGDVEDDSAINMILDRVLDEYKALKSGGSQPISQAQVPASSMARGPAQSSLLPMPGGTMQVPGMQMQQLQDMQMQQQLKQLQGMQSMQTPMVRPLLMPTQTSPLQPPVVSMMQSPPTRLMQPGQSNMQQQMMTSQGPGNRNQGQPNRNQQGQGNRNQGQPNRNQQGPGNQANRNQQGQFNRNQQGQSNRDGPGRDEQPGKMKAILAASLAATLAGKDKKQGMSETTQNKLSAVLRSLNERLEPSQRKRPSRWSSDDAGPKMQQDRHVSPERKRPRDRSPDRGRVGPNQGDRRPTRFDDRPDVKRDIPEPGRGNRGGPPINMQRKEEWMNEMKAMQMGGPNRGGGPRMPGAGGPRGAAPVKSLLPQPGGDMAKGPRMNMPGPGGPGRMDNAGPNVPIDRITALYGDIMNVLAPGSVNTPQEMGVATEMIASLSQAMACVLNNIYSPESQVKIQQSAQKFKLAFGNHPLVQAFFSATSVPPDVIQLLAKLDPMLLKRFVIVLQQARKDIQHQALQSVVFLEQFMVNSNLRM